jgi:hypothetical protein
MLPREGSRHDGDGWTGAALAKTIGTPGEQTGAVYKITIGAVRTSTCVSTERLSMSARA